MFGTSALCKKLSIAAAALFLVLLIVFLVKFYAFGDSDEAKKAAKAAIVSNGLGCATIGTTILDRGGSAADAAIATLFCEGVSMPQSMGLGGGFLMVIYIKESRSAVALNARETAPAYASRDMYNGSSDLSQKGGMAVAVPGELLGYWELYNSYGGKVPWADLVQPTIDLCKSGVPVTKYLAGIYAGKKDLLYKDPVLRDIYINPETNDTYKEGDVVKRLRLARTLEVIAKEGGYALHNGSLTADFVSDLQENNSNITEEDLNNYRPVWSDSISTEFLTGEKLYTTPLPGSGVILTYILNILDGFLDTTQYNTVQTFQRIIESFKFGYGKRTELGDRDNLGELIANLTSRPHAEEIRSKIMDNMTFDDPEYYGANLAGFEDHGTAHVSVLAANGDAISVTSTINFVFGAAFASNSTGIILNDEMDDFSTPNQSNGFDLPPSPANYIVPGKRPMSSMSPSIIVDEDGNVVQVVGAAGGSRIITSVAQLIIKHLWFGMELQTAMYDRRFHHQLLPNWIEFEDEFKNDGMDIVNGLIDIGHNYTFVTADGFSAATSISTRESITGAFDKRRTGTISYLN